MKLTQFLQNLNLIKKTSFSYNLTKDKIADNKKTEPKDVGTERHIFSLFHKFNKKHGIGINTYREQTSNLKQNSIRGSIIENLTFSLNSTPTKELKFNGELTIGKILRKDEENTYKTHNQQEKYKIRWMPSTKFFINFDYENNNFKNVQFKDTQNNKIKLLANYTPSKKLSINTQQQLKKEGYLGVKDQITQGQYILSSNLAENITLNYNLNIHNMKKSNSISEMVQNTISFQYTSNWLNKLSLNLDYSIQKFDMEVYNKTVTYNTKNKIDEVKFTFVAYPFWKEHALSFQTSTTKNEDLVNPSYGSKSVMYKFSIGTPFVSKSNLNIDYTQNDKKGGYAISQKQLTIRLDGNLMKWLNISLSYNDNKYKYKQNSNLNKITSNLTLFLSGNLRFC